MHGLIEELKASGEDFEFYPTTDEILRALVRDIKHERDDHYKRNHSGAVLDIGAGNGKVLMHLRAAELGFSELLAIEKSQILTNEMPDEILVIGTDFKEQSLISKAVSVIFCNPPYSEFEEWTVKIIRECAAPAAYLVIPERWKDSARIADALKFRDTKAKKIGDFDFLDAEDRTARAKVQLLRVDFSEKDDDAFDRFFKEQFAPLIKKFEENCGDKVACENCGSISEYDDGYCKNCNCRKSDKGGGRNRPFQKLVVGADYTAALVSLYMVEMANVQKNYALVGELDADLLREFEISPAKIMALLKKRLSGLRMEYWKELFGRMSPITDRLTSKSRQNLLETLNKHVQVDFTESNILAVIIWAIKNANRYIDSQLLSTYDNMVDKCNVVNYASNRRVFAERGWRYEGEALKNSHYALDYRIVMHRCGGLHSGYWSHNRQCGLDERAFEFMRDMHTVAKNLGFLCNSSFDLAHNGPDWRSNESHTFYYRHRDGESDPEELFEAKAFKNGNLHLRLSKKFALALNVEHGRLRGWIRSREEAAEELKDPEAKNYFRSNHQLLAGPATLHLT